jgi:hypothetical protein
LAAVSVSALVPHHPYREPFNRERGVEQLELVGAIAHQSLWNQGDEVRLRNDLWNEQE